MRVLGIDPGSSEAGYGVLDVEGSKLRFVACGTIMCRPRKPSAERLFELHRGLLEVVEKYKPDAVAIESAFFGLNARTALRLGESRAAAILAAASSGLEVTDYEPRLVKQAVVGRGGASKEQVEGMIRSVVGVGDGPHSEQAFDALAVAVCHSVRSEGGTGGGYLADVLKKAGAGKRRRKTGDSKAWADVVNKRRAKGKS
jgi:crossover junction endodeoxyribonuclease RuvC